MPKEKFEPVLNVEWKSERERVVEGRYEKVTPKPDDPQLLLEKFLESKGKSRHGLSPKEFKELFKEFKQTPEAKEFEKKHDVKIKLPRLGEEQKKKLKEKGFEVEDTED